MVFSCKPVNECYEVLEGYKEQLEAAGLDLSILNPALETPKAPPLTFVQESQKKRRGHIGFAQETYLGLIRVQCPQLNP